MSKSTSDSAVCPDPAFLLDVAVEAALSAGELIRTRIDDVLHVELKDEGNYNLVTEMDRASEDLIKSIVTGRVPGSRYLAEESGGDSRLEALTWVVDPIDGTVNYAHRIPVYAVSIAAVVGGRPVVGVVHGPGTNELFTGILGGGARVDGRPIHVSQTDNIMASVLATGFPYNVAQNPYRCIDAFVDIVSRGIPVRRLGSAALDLAYVAAGRLDAFWEVALAPWDVAAGSLLVAEAGGRIVSYADGEAHPGLTTDRILATNGRLEQAMLAILQEPVSPTRPL